MAAIDLTKYGITGATEIIHNPSYEFLFEEENKPELTGFDKGQLTELDAMILPRFSYSTTFAPCWQRFWNPIFLLSAKRARFLVWASS
jgi:hypothetical protein